MSSGTANAAADGQGEENLVSHPAHHLGGGLAALGAGGDIEEDQLIGAHAVVNAGVFDGIAGIAQVDEAHAFDDPPIFDIQAGDDAPG